MCVHGDVGWTDTQVTSQLNIFMISGLSSLLRFHCVKISTSWICVSKKKKYWFWIVAPSQWYLRLCHDPAVLSGDFDDTGIFFFLKREVDVLYCTNCFQTARWASCSSCTHTKPAWFSTVPTLETINTSEKFIKLDSFWRKNVKVSFYSPCILPAMKLQYPLTKIDLKNACQMHFRIQQNIEYGRDEKKMASFTSRGHNEYLLRPYVLI